MRHLLCLILFLLPGCSGLFLTDAPRPQMRVPIKAAPREKGSIWSEDSRWNTLYASQVSRVSGDNLRIKVSDNLKKEIARTLSQGLDIDELSPDDTTMFEAAVTEVMPRGLLSVQGRSRVKVAGQTGSILLEASVRDRDIASDDSISSDSLYNLIIRKNEEGNETSNR